MQWSPFCAAAHLKSAQQVHNLVQALGRRHRSLDSQAAYILPSLLQERHKVVDSQHDVGDQLVLGHANIPDSNTHAQDLLQLELDGRFDFVDLAAQIFVVGDRRREFTSCAAISLCAESRDVQYLTLGETRTQETGDLLDESVRSNEGIVLASKLLDQLLVLVELLQIVRRHGINSTVLGTINIVLVTEDAVPLSA